MEKFRVLIADDEPAAREGTRALLAQDVEIDVIGECDNGADAATVIIEERPDVVLLDIEMPERDGFQCLELLDPVARPEVVFLTAYDEYAVQAFDVAAADYVLKPFSDARLTEAMNRAKQRVRTKRQQRRTLERLVVRIGRVNHVIDVADLDWIEGAEYYARVHLGDTTHLIRQTLTHLAGQLNPLQFIRVHRSVIVNARKIRQVIVRTEPAVVLDSGKRLPLSRRYRPQLENLLRNRS
ncbi:MAG TPA: LytTR family DNA-binding domain-containing protein [Longimicrobiales bacterium]